MFLSNLGIVFILYDPQRSDNWIQKFLVRLQERGQMISHPPIIHWGEANSANLSSMVQVPSLAAPLTLDTVLVSNHRLQHTLMMEFTVMSTKPRFIPQSGDSRMRKIGALSKNTPAFKVVLNVCS